MAMESVLGKPLESVWVAGLAQVMVKDWPWGLP
jgi:hypothetical protein